ncbi:MAG: hypothetical protein PHU85_14860 [Phycisphaerae bacterium]|nr:hypothetical protein [Phycisphaerae bacterium]
MKADDPQAAGRLCHVCPDVAVAEPVAAAAGALGIPCLRFDDAFAAAHELLAHPVPNTVLLIAMDSLSRAESRLPAWAAARFADLTVWLHGSPARLNGHLAQGRIKLVQLSQIQTLLAAHCGMSVSPMSETRESTGDTPGPAIEQPPFSRTTEGRRAESSLVMAPLPLLPDEELAEAIKQEAVEHEPLDQPADAVFKLDRPEVSALTADERMFVADEPEKKVQKPFPQGVSREEGRGGEMDSDPFSPADSEKPPLRLRQTTSQPLLTDEELIALLGPDEGGEGGDGD